MCRRFVSEHDTWMIVLGYGAVVITAVVLSPLLVTNANGVIKAITGGLLILTVVLVSWVYFGTYYVVSVKELRVRSGPFRWRIPIEEIHRVTQTRSPLSSPALSLNRLRIDYGDGKWIMISPERREEFIQSLGVPVT